MIFAAPYIDESGTHDGAPAMALAGYVSTVGQWDVFSKEWNDILDDLSKLLSKRIEYFHMAKFAGNFEDYRPLAESPDQKRMFANRILGAIRKHKEFGFSASVRVDDYDAIVNTLQLKASFGNAYIFLAQACLGWVGNWVAEWERDGRGAIEPIIYTFEKGAEHENALVPSADTNS